MYDKRNEEVRMMNEKFEIIMFVVVGGLIGLVLIYWLNS